MRYVLVLLTLVPLVLTWAACRAASQADRRMEQIRRAEGAGGERERRAFGRGGSTGTRQASQRNGRR